MPDGKYKVKMGFGMHCGWAIEGAIGSEFKIDASYLSSNVNISSRLEAATKQFGVTFLISGQIFNLCREPLQSKMRMLDRVKVKGSEQPIDLFTMDLDMRDLTPELSKKEEMLSGVERKKMRIEMRSKRRILMEDMIDHERSIISVMNEDKNIRSMRRIFTKDFYSEWGHGVKAYLEGDWQEAKIRFETTQVSS